MCSTLLITAGPLMSQKCGGSICMSLHHPHMTHDSSGRDLIVMQARDNVPSLIDVFTWWRHRHFSSKPSSLNLIKCDNSKQDFISPSNKNKRKYFWLRMSDSVC